MRLAQAQPNRHRCRRLACGSTSDEGATPWRDRHASAVACVRAQGRRRWTWLQGEEIQLAARAVTQQACQAVPAADSPPCRRHAACATAAARQHYFSACARHAPSRPHQSKPVQRACQGRVLELQPDHKWLVGRAWQGGGCAAPQCARARPVRPVCAILGAHQRGSGHLQPLACLRRSQSWRA